MCVVVDACESSSLIDVCVCVRVCVRGCESAVVVDACESSSLEHVSAYISPCFVLLPPWVFLMMDLHLWTFMRTMLLKFLLSCWNPNDIFQVCE